MKVIEICILYFVYVKVILPLAVVYLRNVENQFAVGLLFSLQVCNNSGPRSKN